MLESYDSKINDYFYEKNEQLEVTDLPGFPNSFAVYRDGTLDWVPKNKVKLI